MIITINLLIYFLFTSKLINLINLKFLYSSHVYYDHLASVAYCLI